MALQTGPAGRKRQPETVSRFLSDAGLACVAIESLKAAAYLPAWHKGCPVRVLLRVPVTFGDPQA
jgi:hypothetical protein